MSFFCDSCHEWIEDLGGNQSGGREYCDDCWFSIPGSLEKLEEDEEKK